MREQRAQRAKFAAATLLAALIALPAVTAVGDSCCACGSICLGGGGTRGCVSVPEFVPDCESACGCFIGQPTPPSSSACSQFPECGQSLCDDGDPCTSDFPNPILGGVCTHLPCCVDDNPCTADLCEAQTGECSHPPALIDSCTEAEHAALAIVNGGTPARNRLKWDWRKAQGNEPDWFNNQLGYLKSYTLCLFAGTASSLIALHAPIDIPSSDGWQLDDDRFGASYRYEAAQSYGVQSARTDADPGGRARIGVKARSTRLANTGLPIGPDLRPVTIQLQRNNGTACWQSTFSEASERRDGVLRARK